MHQTIILRKHGSGKPAKIPVNGNNVEPRQKVKFLKVGCLIRDANFDFSLKIRRHFSIILYLVTCTSLSEDRNLCLHARI